MNLAVFALALCATQEPQPLKPGESAEFQIPWDPQIARLSASGRFLYLYRPETGQFAVADLESRKIVVEKLLEDRPQSVAVTRGRFWMCGGASRDLRSFSEETMDFVDPVPLGTGIHELADTCVPLPDPIVHVVSKSTSGLPDIVFRRIRVDRDETTRWTTSDDMIPRGRMSADGNYYYASGQGEARVVRIGEKLEVVSRFRDIKWRWSADFTAWGNLTGADGGLRDRHLAPISHVPEGTPAFHADCPYFVEYTSSTLIFREVMTQKLLEKVDILPKADVSRASGRVFLTPERVIAIPQGAVRIVAYDAEKILAHDPLGIVMPPHGLKLGETFLYRPSFGRMSGRETRYYLAKSPAGAKINEKGEVEWVPTITDLAKHGPLIPFELRVLQGDTPRGSFPFSIHLSVREFVIGTRDGLPESDLRAPGVTTDGRFFVALDSKSFYALVIPLPPTGRVHAIQVGNDPYAWCARGDRLFVSNRVSKTVSVISLAKLAVEKTLTMPQDSRPSLMAACENAPRVYVALFDPAGAGHTADFRKKMQVLTIQSDTLAVESPLSFGPDRVAQLHVERMEASCDGKRLYLMHAQKIRPVAFELRSGRMEFAGPDQEIDRFLQAHPWQDRVFTTAGIYDGSLKKQAVRYPDFPREEAIPILEPEWRIFFVASGFSSTRALRRLLVVDGEKGAFLETLDVPLPQADGGASARDAIVFWRGRTAVWVPVKDVLDRVNQGRAVAAAKRGGVADPKAKGQAREKEKRGVDLLNAGKPAEARPFLYKALELDPYGPAQIHIAESFRKEGRTEEALAEFEKAMIVAYDDPAHCVDAGARYGKYCMELQKWSKAVVAFRGALVHAPKRPDLWMSLSRAYEQSDEIGPALECAQKALEHDSTAQATVTRLGKLWREKNTVACTPCNGTGKSGGGACSTCGGAGKAVRMRCLSCDGGGAVYEFATVEIEGVVLEVWVARACKKCEGRGYRLEKK